MKIEEVWPEWSAVGEPIGRGSYGVVYKCVCREAGKEKYSAIKVISVPQDDINYSSLSAEKQESIKAEYKEIVDSFSNEIKILETLKGNKNIVAIEDSKVVEKDNGIGWQIFIRMELLTDLEEYMESHTFEKEEKLKLGMDLCQALKACGEKKIIHRDIKPKNIFVDGEGNFKLGDFGVAKQLEKTTASLSRKGTYEYMSPEVYHSQKCDSRADVYSLAIVLYRLFNKNNRLPFLNTEKQMLTSSERGNAFNRRINGERIPPMKDVDENINITLLRALEYKKEDRFKNVEEFETALKRCAQGKRTQKSFKQIMENRVIAKAVSIILVVSIVFGVLAIYLNHSPFKKELETIIINETTESTIKSTTTTTTITTKEATTKGSPTKETTTEESITKETTEKIKEEKGKTASVKDISSYSVGDIITYGSYPQSKVTDQATINRIKNNESKYSWVSYNYYSGTGSPADGNMKCDEGMMYYKDISYNGNVYRAVKINSYRPTRTGYKEIVSSSTSVGNTFQDDNGYYTGNVYYFKFEPLKWRVLSPSEGLVMCNKAIDSQAYNNYLLTVNGNHYGNSSKSYDASSWANSSIRAWLNNDFYNTAFSTSEQSQIETSNNETKEYFSNSSPITKTSDKIFILSHSEVLVSSYGFSSNYEEYDKSRQLKSTDYAQCQGCYKSTNNSYYGNVWWCLRGAFGSAWIQPVFDDGGAYNYDGGEVDKTWYGVVPAFKFIGNL